MKDGQLLKTSIGWWFRSRARSIGISRLVQNRTRLPVRAFGNRRVRLSEPTKSAMVSCEVKGILMSVSASTDVASRFNPVPWYFQEWVLILWLKEHNATYTTPEPSSNAFPLSSDSLNHPSSRGTLPPHLDQRSSARSRTKSVPKSKPLRKLKGNKRRNEAVNSNHPKWK